MTETKPKERLTLIGLPENIAILLNAYAYENHVTKKKVITEAVKRLFIEFQNNNFVCECEEKHKCKNQ